MRREIRIVLRDRPARHRFRRFEQPHVLVQLRQVRAAHRPVLIQSKFRPEHRPAIIQVIGPFEIANGAVRIPLLLADQRRDPPRRRIPRIQGRRAPQLLQTAPRIARRSPRLAQITAHQRARRIQGRRRLKGLQRLPRATQCLQRQAASHPDFRIRTIPLQRLVEGVQRHRTPVPRQRDPALHRRSHGTRRRQPTSRLQGRLRRLEPLQHELQLTHPQRRRPKSRSHPPRKPRHPRRSLQVSRPLQPIRLRQPFTRTRTRGFRLAHRGRPRPIPAHRRNQSPQRSLLRTLLRAFQHLQRLLDLTYGKQQRRPQKSHAVLRRRLDRHAAQRPQHIARAIRLQGLPPCGYFGFRHPDRRRIHDHRIMKRPLHPGPRHQTTSHRLPSLPQQDRFPTVRLHLASVLAQHDPAIQQVQDRLLPARHLQDKLRPSNRTRRHRRLKLHVFRSLAVEEKQPAQFQKEPPTRLLPA